MLSIRCNSHIKSWRKPLYNELQWRDQIRPKFNGAWLRNNWPKIKDGIYVLNQDMYK